MSHTEFISRSCSLFTGHSKSNESSQITQLTTEAVRPLTISNPGYSQTENRRNPDIFHTRKPGFIVAFKFRFSGLKWAVIASENASIASSTECSMDTQWLVVSPLVIIQYRSVSRRFGTTPEVSGQFGYGPEVSRDTSGPYPNCLGTEVSWSRSVRKAVNRGWEQKSDKYGW